jgi:hypothetical protein
LWRFSYACNSPPDYCGRHDDSCFYL